MNTIERKEDLKEKYGWLASLVSGTIVTGFKILESFFKFIFNLLKALAG